MIIKLRPHHLPGFSAATHCEESEGVAGRGVLMRWQGRGHAMHVVDSILKIHVKKGWENIRSGGFWEGRL